MLNLFERCYFLLESMVPLHIVQEIEELPSSFFNAMIEQEIAKSNSMCMIEFDQNNWIEILDNKQNWSGRSDKKAWSYHRKGERCILFSKRNEPDDFNGLFFQLETGKRTWFTRFRKKRIQYFHKDKFGDWHKLPYSPWRESLLKELRAE